MELSNTVMDILGQGLNGKDLGLFLNPSTASDIDFVQPC